MISGMKPTNDQQLVFAILRHALADLVVKDHELFVLSAHEQTISHRLALYIEQHYKKRLHYFSYSSFDLVKIVADCEFNRHGGREKFLEGIRQKYPKKPTDVVRPDIILHQRSESLNLLVVELTSGGESDFAYACDKVRGFVETEFAYELGTVIWMHADGRVDRPLRQVATFRKGFEMLNNFRLKDWVHHHIPHHATDTNIAPSDGLEDYRPWSPEVNEYWEDVYS